MPRRTADPTTDLVARFRRRTLTKAEWTHEAHLVVCLHAVRELGAGAVEHLRGAIRAFNEVTGTANTDDSGYHETLTRYFVGAVAHLADDQCGDRDPAGTVRDDDVVDDVADDPAGEMSSVLATVLASPLCRRDAPLRHWSRDRLFSVAARRGWLAPDLEPLPW